MERGYRFCYSKDRSLSKVNRTTVIISERLDKSTYDPRDISYEQAEGAGGLQISSKPKKLVSEEFEPTKSNSDTCQNESLCMVMLVDPAGLQLGE